MESVARAAAHFSDDVNYKLKKDPSIISNAEILIRHLNLMTLTERERLFLWNKYRKFVLNNTMVAFLRIVSINLQISYISLI